MTAPAAGAVAAAALAEQYRQAQVQLSTRTMRDMILIWPLLLQNRSESERRWLAMALAVVRRDRAQSARYASDFLAAYRYLELGTRGAGSFTPRPMLDLPTEQVMNSLISVGPKAMEKKIRELNEPVKAGQRADDPVVKPKEPITALHKDSAAARIVRDGTARAAQRHALNGGRDTIDDVVLNDPEVQGYLRLTDSDPCFFCAVLASRGAVYEEQSFVDSDPRFHGPGNQKVHDGCACTLVPIYTRDSPLEDRSREFSALWYDDDGDLKSPSSYSGHRALLEYRRKYEGRKAYRADA